MSLVDPLARKQAAEIQLKMTVYWLVDGLVLLFGSFDYDDAWAEARALTDYPAELTPQQLDHLESIVDVRRDQYNYAQKHLWDRLREAQEMPIDLEAAYWWMKQTETDRRELERLFLRVDALEADVATALRALKRFL